MSRDPAIAPPPSHPDHSDAKHLAAEITELCSYIYAAECRLLSLIREFDEHEYWAEAGVCSCAHWLNLKCGIGMNAAREKVRVARALPNLSQIGAAFACGELSYSKVRALTRVADATNEEYLLMIARHGTAHHVERLVSKYRVARRLQDSHEVEKDHKSRELTFFHDDDGCLVIRARIPAEKGALLLKALEVALEQSPPHDVTAETPDRDTIAARRVDALTEVAETFLGNREPKGTTADRYQVVLHVTAETCHLEDGTGVARETSRRVACDSSIVKVHESQDAKPMSVGRRSRSIPPAIRRALCRRDQSCRFPGCINTRFLDGHHIEHWADGGETSLDNLVLLCRRHHRLVHDGGFACEKDENSNVVFRNRQAEMLNVANPLPGVAHAEDLQTWLDRNFFEAGIDSETCVPEYRAGERMDWQMAVSAMFPR